MARIGTSTVRFGPSSARQRTRHVRVSVFVIDVVHDLLDFGTLAEVVMTRFTKIGTPYYGRRTLAEVVITRFPQIGTYYYGGRTLAEVVITRFPPNRDLLLLLWPTDARGSRYHSISLPEPVWSEAPESKTTLKS